MRLFILSIILIACYSLILPNSLYADEEKRAEQELEEVSVTATRMERSTAEVPASVAVIEEEDIEDTKMFNIKDALLGTPGVLIDTRNEGYDSRLIIRGAGLKARYGVREIMVLMDGIPITDPDSLTRLDFVDTQLIEKVEVVKGPNSTLWGTNAAGGVVNIITRSPFEREGGILKVGLGDYNTRNYHLSYSGNTGGRLFLTVNGSRRETDNSWRRWNEFWTNQFSIQPSLIFADGTTMENHFSYTESSLQLPGSLSEEQYEEYRNTGRADETFGPWQYSGRYSDIYFLSSRLTKEVGVFEFKPVIFVNKWSHHHPVTGRINDADTITYGTEIQINNNHSIGGMKGTLSSGVTLRYDDQETDYFEYSEYETGYKGRITEVLSDKSGELSERQYREVLLWGVYAQESLRPTERVIVDFGIRYDRVEFGISGTKWSDFDWGSGTYVDCPDPKLSNCGDYDIEKSYNAISPRVGLTYKLNDLLHLYGNISTGVQTPTEGEISDNPDLNLVKVQNYETGIKGRHQRWSFDSAVYFSPVKDEVVQVIQEGGISEYLNAGETEKKGFEFSGSYSLTPELSLGVSYAYSDYTFKEFSEPVRTGGTTVNIDRSGNRLPYVPMHQYSINASYKHPIGLKLKVWANTWGSYYMDNANTEKYGGYEFITNAMVGYEKGDLEVALNVDNVFNERYAVEVTKDTSGVKRYTPASPRNFMVRLTYKF